MLRLLILTCCSFALLAADPPAVVKVIDEVAKAEEVARKAYDAAVAKAKEKAIADLLKIQEGLTKKGDLDGALLVRERIAELNADIDLLGNPTKGSAGGGAEAQAKRIAAGKITTQEYERIAGREITVEARAVLDTKVVLAKGERYLVFPNPTDLWAAAHSGEHSEPVNYLGREAGDPRSEDAPMSLVIRVDAAVMPGFIAQGEGRLFLSAKDGGLEDNTGKVRVKLVRIR